MDVKGLAMWFGSLGVSGFWKVGGFYGLGDIVWFEAGSENCFGVLIVPYLGVMRVGWVVVSL